MKIEKLTENKIRVVINDNDLSKTNTDLHSLMTKTLETQELFFDILEKAQREVNFDTDGYKLLIEVFSSIEEFLVFTITKYSPNDTTNKNQTPKKLIAKRKSLAIIKKQSIYSFVNFEAFCDFCKALSHTCEFDWKKLSKNISLYLYNDTYFLSLNNINKKTENISVLYSLLSEFGEITSYSNIFENKLLEYGKTIMKKDAINIGIKYFAI